MKVEIHAPSDYAGDLMGDLNGRRGRISGMDTRGAMTVIRAQVPMAEMLTYEQHLTSATGGRGVVPHGVLALRRGAVAPAAEDHRRVQGGARRRSGRSLDTALTYVGRGFTRSVATTPPFRGGLRTAVFAYQKSHWRENPELQPRDRHVAHAVSPELRGVAIDVTHVLNDHGAAWLQDARDLRDRAIATGLVRHVVNRQARDHEINAGIG